MTIPILAARRPPHVDVTQIPTPPLQRTAIALNFLFPALALSIVALRCYSRLRFRQFGIDDFLICCAMLFSLLMCPFFYMYIKLTYVGWYAKDVPQPYDPEPGAWWFFVAQLFYNPVLAFVKASVLVFLLRLGGHQRRIRWCIHGINIFNALQAIAVFLVALLQCLPISANWDPVSKTTARCVDNSFHVVISSLTILTDIAVIILPFWIFLGLKMPTPAKIAVLGVFLLSLTVLIASIVRMVKLVQLFYAPSSLKDPFHDIGTILNVVEINIAIVSASGPALRGLFRRWMPAWFGGSSGGKYGTGGGRSSGNRYGYGYGYGHGSRGGGGAAYGRGTATRSQHAPPTREEGSSIALKNMHSSSHHRASRAQRTEIRSVSPTGSEEEIMTYNGIMRTTDVQVHYDRDGRDDDDDAGTLEAGGRRSRHSRTSSDFKMVDKL